MYINKLAIRQRTKKIGTFAKQTTTGDHRTLVALLASKTTRHIPKSEHKRSGRGEATKCNHSMGGAPGDHQERIQRFRRHTCQPVRVCGSIRHDAQDRSRVAAVRARDQAAGGRHSRRRSSVQFDLRTRGRRASLATSRSRSRGSE